MVNQLFSACNRNNSKNHSNFSEIGNRLPKQQNSHCKSSDVVKNRIQSSGCCQRKILLVVKPRPHGRIKSPKTKCHNWFLCFCTVVTN